MTQNKQISKFGHIRLRARRRVVDPIFESDSTYFLKLVVFLILGTLWLKFAQPLVWLGVPFYGVPLGLIIGVFAVSRFEAYQTDRKIWYAILLIATLVSYFLPLGIVI